MNIILWIAQGLLAAMYLMAGSMKAFQPAKVRENPDQKSCRRHAVEIRGGTPP